MDKHNFKPTKEYNGIEFGVHAESAGYRSAQQQIESFLYAGEILKASRESSFDTSEDDPEEDPSLDIRDMELSEFGAMMSRKQFEVPKVVYEEETGVSVSSSEKEKSTDEVEA